MSGNICLNVAQRHVREYADESDALMSAHRDAIDCWKCQEFLQKGINAYQWLKRAEEFLREADYQGVFDFSAELQDAVYALYEAWLRSCVFADKWIAAHVEQGYRIDNLEQFHGIRDEVEDVVQRREWRKAATSARTLASSAENTDE